MRFESIEQHFDRIDKHLERIDKHFDGVPSTRTPAYTSEAKYHVQGFWQIEDTSPDQDGSRA